MVLARSISFIFQSISKTDAIEAMPLSILWTIETLFRFIDSILVSIGKFSTVTRFVTLRMPEFKAKAGMLKRFENSALMEKDDEYKPLVFVSHGAEKGRRIPFP